MSIPSVRMMQADEARVVARLLARANEENVATFPREVAAAYRAELEDGTSLRVGDTYVAELDGLVVGTVTYLRDAADDGHPWPDGGAVLRFLAVDATARGAGLGGRLAGTCVERARADGRTFLGLHTAPSMAAAQRLYERLGFERTPAHDFDPLAHYAGSSRGEAEPWGMAYLLRLA